MGCLADNPMVSRYSPARLPRAHPQITPGFLLIRLIKCQFIGLYQEAVAGLQSILFIVKAEQPPAAEHVMNQVMRFGSRSETVQAFRLGAATAVYIQASRFIIFKSSLNAFSICKTSLLSALSHILAVVLFTLWPTPEYASAADVSCPRSTCCPGQRSCPLSYRWNYAGQSSRICPRPPASARQNLSRSLPPRLFPEHVFSEHKFLLFHIRLHLLQVLPDVKLLGTGFLAFTAFDTVLCLFFVSQVLLPAVFNHIIILVHMVGIPHPEIARDVHACRAWHAIPACGTAVLHPAPDQRHDIIDGFRLFVRKGTKIRKVSDYPPPAPWWTYRSERLSHWANFPPSAAHRRPRKPPGPERGISP